MYLDSFFGIIPKLYADSSYAIIANIIINGNLLPLTNLNKQQLTAATANFGHNLIIASAGTGKTSTIVGRIAYLLKQGVQPHEILLLTFTNKVSQAILMLEHFMPLAIDGLKKTILKLHLNSQENLKHFLEVFTIGVIFLI